MFRVPQIVRLFLNWITENGRDETSPKHFFHFGKVSIFVSMYTVGMTETMVHVEMKTPRGMQIIPFMMDMAIPFVFRIVYNQAVF